MEAFVIYPRLEARDRAQAQLAVAKRRRDAADEGGLVDEQQRHYSLPRLVGEQHVCVEELGDPAQRLMLTFELPLAGSVLFADPLSACVQGAA